MEQRLREFEAKGLCGKTPFMKRLVPNFMEKARHNLLFCNAVYGLSNNAEAKKLLRLKEDFSAFDWVVITVASGKTHDFNRGMKAY